MAYQSNSGRFFCPTSPLLYPQHPVGEHIMPWIADFPLLTPAEISTLAEICVSSAELATDLRFWSYPSQPAEDTSTAYLGTSYTVYNTSPTPQKEEDLTRRIVDWYPPQVHHVGVDTTASGSGVTHIPDFPSMQHRCIQHHISESEPRMAGFNPSPTSTALHPFETTPHSTHPTIPIVDSTSHGHESQAQRRQIARMGRRRTVLPYFVHCPSPNITPPSDERNRPPEYGKIIQKDQTCFRQDQGEAKTTNKNRFEEEDGRTEDYLSSGSSPSEREIRCRTQNTVRSAKARTADEKPVGTPAKRSRKGGMDNIHEYGYKPTPNQKRKSKNKSTTAAAANQAVEEAVRVKAQASTSQRFHSHAKDNFAILYIQYDAPKGWKPVAITTPVDAGEFTPTTSLNSGPRSQC